MTVKNLVDFLLHWQARSGVILAGDLGKWQGWKTELLLYYIWNRNQGGLAAAPKPSPWVPAWLEMFSSVLALLTI